MWTALYLCGQPCICVDSPVYMWTTLYLCEQPCIYMDSPVSMWTAPFSFSIGQNRFCVDVSVSVYTRGSI